MQKSLFDNIPTESNKTLEQINAEMLEKGKLLFPDKVFIFGVTAETNRHKVV